MKRVHTLIAGLLIFAGPMAGHAHGDKHSSKAHPSALDQEQMPWGMAASADKVSRTVEVDMSDQMRFSPDKQQFRVGDTVRFKIRNLGKLKHEFVIGTLAENKKHAAMMVKFPMMEHDEAYMAHVDPGSIGEIIWTFNRAGQFEFACLIAGHYQAGMVGLISVSE